MSGPLGAVLFLGTRSPTYSGRARQFCAPLRSGESLKRGDPRLALRNAYISNRHKSGRGGVHPIWGFIACTLAWNSFIRQQDHLTLNVGAVKGDPPNILGAPKFGAGLAALHPHRRVA